MSFQPTPSATATPAKRHTIISTAAAIKSDSTAKIDTSRRPVSRGGENGVNQRPVSRGGENGINQRPVSRGSEVNSTQQRPVSRGSEVNSTQQRSITRSSGDTNTTQQRPLSRTSDLSSSNTSNQQRPIPRGLETTPRPISRISKETLQQNSNLNIYQRPVSQNGSARAPLDPSFSNSTFTTPNKRRSLADLPSNTPNLTRSHSIHNNPNPNSLYQTPLHSRVSLNGGNSSSSTTTNNTVISINNPPSSTRRTIGQKNTSQALATVLATPTNPHETSISILDRSTSSISGLGLGGGDGFDVFNNSSTTVATAPIPSGPGAADRINVCLRIRPAKPDDKRVLMPKPKSTDAVVLLEETRNRAQETIISERDYGFDHVFAENAIQSDVYQIVGAPAIDNLLLGFNATILAYGQTSSGKTHTMRGDDGNSNDGLVPSCAKKLFSVIHPKRHIVVVSYQEVYNEEVYDLLSIHTDQKLKIRELGKLSFYSEGLTEVTVRSLEEVLAVIERGDSKRRTASTKQNHRSSRSHAILTIQLKHILTNETDENETESNQNIVDDVENANNGDNVDTGVDTNFNNTINDTLNDSMMSNTSMQSRMSINSTFNLNTTTTVTTTQKDHPITYDVDKVLVSKLNLVDLAGSERYNEGSLGTESTNINKSLSSLSKVISELATRKEKNGQTSKVHINYRDSKLTQLLSETLSGRAKTTLIACVSPVIENMNETASTLSFAKTAKNIAVQVTRFGDETNKAAKAKLHLQLQEQEKLVSEKEAKIREKDREIEKVQKETELITWRNSLLKQQYKSELFYQKDSIEPMLDDILRILLPQPHQQLQQQQQQQRLKKKQAHAQFFNEGEIEEKKSDDQAREVQDGIDRSKSRTSVPTIPLPKPDFDGLNENSDENGYDIHADVDVDVDVDAPFNYETVDANEVHTIDTNDTIDVADDVDDDDADTDIDDEVNNEIPKAILRLRRMFSLAKNITVEDVLQAQAAMDAEALANTDVNADTNCTGSNNENDENNNITIDDEIIPLPSEYLPDLYVDTVFNTSTPSILLNNSDNGGNGDDSNNSNNSNNNDDSNNNNTQHTEDNDTTDTTDNDIKNETQTQLQSFTNNNFTFISPFSTPIHNRRKTHGDMHPAASLSLQSPSQSKQLTLESLSSSSGISAVTRALLTPTSNRVIKCEIGSPASTQSRTRYYDKLELQIKLMKQIMDDLTSGRLAYIEHLPLSIQEIIQNSGAVTEDIQTIKQSTIDADTYSTATHSNSNSLALHTPIISDVLVSKASYDELKEMYETQEIEMQEMRALLELRDQEISVLQSESLEDKYQQENLINQVNSLTQTLNTQEEQYQDEKQATEKKVEELQKKIETTVEEAKVSFEELKKETEIQLLTQVKVHEETISLVQEEKLQIEAQKTEMEVEKAQMEVEKAQIEQELTITKHNFDTKYNNFAEEQLQLQRNLQSQLDTKTAQCVEITDQNSTFEAIIQQREADITTQNLKIHELEDLVSKHATKLVAMNQDMETLEMELEQMKAEKEEMGEIGGIEGIGEMGEENSGQIGSIMPFIPSTLQSPPVISAINNGDNEISDTNLTASTPAINLGGDDPKAAELAITIEVLKETLFAIQSSILYKEEQLYQARNEIHALKRTNGHGSQGNGMNFASNKRSQDSSEAANSTISPKYQLSSIDNEDVHQRSSVSNSHSLQNHNITSFKQILENYHNQQSSKIQLQLKNVDQIREKCGVYYTVKDTILDTISKIYHNYTDDITTFQEINNNILSSQLIIEDYQKQISQLQCQVDEHDEIYRSKQSQLYDEIHDKMHDLQVKYEDYNKKYENNNIRQEELLKKEASLQTREQITQNTRENSEKIESKYQETIDKMLHFAQIVENTTATMTQLQEKLTLSEAETINYITLYESAMETIKIFEFDQLSHIDEIQNKTEMLELQEAELEQKQDMIDELTVMTHELQDKLVELQQEIVMQEELHTNLTSTNENIQLNYENLQSNYQDLQSNYEDLQLNHDLIQDKMEKYESQIQEKQQLVKQLEVAQVSLQDELKELQNHLRQQEEKIEQQNHQQNQQQNQYQTQYENQLQKQEFLSRDLNDKTTQITILQKENHNYQNQISTLESEIKDLQNTIEALELAVSEAMSAIEDAHNAQSQVLDIQSTFESEYHQTAESYRQMLITVEDNLHELEIQYEIKCAEYQEQGLSLEEVTKSLYQNNDIIKKLCHIQEGLEDDIQSACNQVDLLTLNIQTLHHDKQVLFTQVQNMGEYNGILLKQSTYYHAKCKLLQNEFIRCITNIFGDNFYESHLLQKYKQEFGFCEEGGELKRGMKVENVEDAENVDKESMISDIDEVGDQITATTNTETNTHENTHAKIVKYDYSSISALELINVWTIHMKQIEKEERDAYDEIYNQINNVHIDSNSHENTSISDQNVVYARLFTSTTSYTNQWITSIISSYQQFVNKGGKNNNDNNSPQKTQETNLITQTVNQPYVVDAEYYPSLQGTPIYALLSNGNWIIMNGVELSTVFEYATLLEISIYDILTKLFHSTTRPLDVNKEDDLDDLDDLDAKITKNIDNKHHTSSMSQIPIPTWYTHQDFISSQQIHTMEDEISHIFPNIQCIVYNTNPRIIYPSSLDTNEPAYVLSLQTYKDFGFLSQVPERCSYPGSYPEHESMSASVSASASASASHSTNSTDLNNLMNPNAHQIYSIIEANSNIIDYALNAVITSNGIGNININTDDQIVSTHCLSDSHLQIGNTNTNQSHDPSHFSPSNQYPSLESEVVSLIIQKNTRLRYLFKKYPTISQYFRDHISTQIQKRVKRLENYSHNNFSTSVSSSMPSSSSSSSSFSQNISFSTQSRSNDKHNTGLSRNLGSNLGNNLGSNVGSNVGSSVGVNISPINLERSQKMEEWNYEFLDLAFRVSNYHQEIENIFHTVQIEQQIKDDSIINSENLTNSTSSSSSSNSSSMQAQYKPLSRYGQPLSKPVSHVLTVDTDQTSGLEELENSPLQRQDSLLQSTQIKDAYFHQNSRKPQDIQKEEENTKLLNIYLNMHQYIPHEYDIAIMGMLQSSNQMSNQVQESRQADVDNNNNEYDSHDKENMYQSKPQHYQRQPHRLGANSMINTDTVNVVSAVNHNRNIMKSPSNLSYLKIDTVEQFEISPTSISHTNDLLQPSKSNLSHHEQYTDSRFNKSAQIQKQYHENRQKKKQQSNTSSPTNNSNNQDKNCVIM